MKQKHTPTLGRLPINEMTGEQLIAWIRATRTALQQKMQRERNYLDRRAARNTHTPTDDAYDYVSSKVNPFDLLFDAPFRAFSMAVREAQRHPGLRFCEPGARAMPPLTGVGERL
jgi:hypothetical protein